MHQREQPRAELAVRVAGAGPPLLLLHGAGVSGEVFAHLIPVLAERHHVLTPDLRGHGESGALGGPFDAASLAADLGPLLDAHGIASVHLLGHSYGGAVAQVFARRHPERVRSLILVSSYADRPLTWWERLVVRAAPPLVATLGTALLARLLRLARPAGGGRRLGPAAAAHLAAAVQVNSGERMAAALRAASRFDSRVWLPALQAPALVVAGAADYLVTSRQARLLASAIPGARLALIPDGGHALPLTHPAALADLIGDWIAAVEVAAPVRAAGAG